MEHERHEIPRKSRALFAFFAPFRGVRGPIPFAVVASSLMLDTKHWNTKATKYRESRELFSRVFAPLSRIRGTVRESNPFRSGCFISYARHKALEHESHEIPRKSRALFAFFAPFRAVRGPIPFAQFVVQSLAQWWLHLLRSTQSIGTRKPRNTAKVASSFAYFAPFALFVVAPFRAVRGPIPFAVVASSLMLDTKHWNTKDTKYRESRELFSRTFRSLSRCSWSNPFRAFRGPISFSRSSWSNPFRAVRGPTSLLIALLRYYRRIIFWVKAILVRNC